MLLSEEWLVFMQCWVVFLLVNKCRLTGTLSLFLFFYINIYIYISKGRRCQRSMC